MTTQPADHRKLRAAQIIRVAVLLAVPELAVGLGMLVALTWEYLALGRPELSSFSLAVTSTCRQLACEVALVPTSLVETHSTEKYNEISSLVSSLGWHWSLPLGSASLHSELMVDVPDFEVLIHGGHLHLVGPVLGVEFPSARTQPVTQNYSLIDNGQ